MDALYEGARNFSNLTTKEYVIKISQNKKIIEIKLDFRNNDYHHLVGFQYLKDLSSIPRNSEKALNHVLNQKITYDFISKSVFFHEVKDSYADVESRVKYFQYLEKFIDNDNIILTYVKYKNPYSSMLADFLIESTIDNITVYIFLRKRIYEDKYCICSFFQKVEVSYYGEKAYYLYKEKIDIPSDTHIIYINKLDK